MSYAPQSSPGQSRLPACVVALLLLAGPAWAQEERRLQTPTDLHRDPDGTPLVALPAGAQVEAGKADGDWRQVTVEGWIYQPSTSPTKRDGFDLVVTSGLGTLFPKGLPVGRVVKIEDKGSALFHFAVLAPAVDFSRVEEVLLVTGQTSQDLAVLFPTDG